MFSNMTDWKGEVVAIFIGPHAKEPMVAVDTVNAVAGRGLEGDRYFEQRGSFSKPDEIEPKQEITLIESEAVESAANTYGVALRPSDSRRNIVTRGVALNHLVGKEFAVGNTRLRGIKLNEPCRHLVSVAGKPMIKLLRHRGGLRAQIVAGGRIAVGDEVTPG
jgi:MOSC domain-containing protein YiiM